MIIRFYVENKRVMPHLRITLKKLARNQADTVETSFVVLKNSIKGTTFIGELGGLYELTLQNVRPEHTTVYNRTDYTALRTGEPVPFHTYIQNRLIPLITPASTTNEIAPGDSAESEVPTRQHARPRHDP